MDILMVSAELSPYARASEAGDAVASLGKALRQLGHEVTVALPRYPSLESSGLMMARRLTPLALGSGGEVTVHDCQLPSGVKLVLFDAPVLFERPGIYGEHGEDYPDNAKRFALLCEAAAALIRQRAQLGKAFDILHIHDWPAALVPMALRRELDPSLPSVLTIHDVTRQGSFALKELDALGLPRELAEEGLRLGNRLNILKAGIGFADAITTVSPAYCHELTSEARAGSLAEVIAASGKPIVGVSNGLDYATFNPATDGALISRYDAEDSSNKATNKTALLRERDLELEPERPLLVVMGEVGRERGLDVVAGALPNILKNPVNVLFAVRGTASFVDKVQKLAERFPESLAVVHDHSDTAVRRMLAAADMQVLSARHEPSGVAAMAAQRYGVLPIALATGGIKDVVVDGDASFETGTGILFDALTQKEVLGAVGRALAIYASPVWPKLVRRIMRLDHGWDRPARRYLQVYRQTIGARA